MLPKLNIKENKNASLKVFGGLDRRDKISDISFTDMTNISPDALPAIKPREPRKEITDLTSAVTVCSPEITSDELSSFTGIANNKFYYNGTMISGTLTEGKKSIADFNGKICIFPDKVYYDYNPDPETGVVGNSLVSMEKATTVKNAKFYSFIDEVTGSYTAYISSISAKFLSYFAEGDSIVISGCSKYYNNTVTAAERKEIVSANSIVSAVVTSVSDNKLSLVLYNNSGEKVGFESTVEANTVTLKIAVPDMDNICVHNNRLWGTSTNGEYVYASKLGDCTNFNSFQGLANDSWYSYIATGGRFTGICSYRTSVIVFKQNYIHHIYGDAPTNFSIPKQTYGGCIDGKSICEIGGILYYLTNNGFYAYSGGEPYSVSPQLNVKYSSCAAGTDGRHYYASAIREDGTCEVLVYSPEKDIWVREDDTPFIDFCLYNGKLYGITSDKMMMLCGGDENFTWQTISKRFTYDATDYKGLSCIWLRMDLGNNSEVAVSVSKDNNDFELCGTISGNGEFSVYRVPIRFGKCNSFRIMLEGTGNATIHDIEIKSYNGGRIYG